MAGWLAGWLSGWLAGWLAGGLAGWLVQICFEEIAHETIGYVTNFDSISELIDLRWAGCLAYV